MKIFSKIILCIKCNEEVSGRLSRPLAIPGEQDPRRELDQLRFRKYYEWAGVKYVDSSFRRVCGQNT